MVMLPNFAGYDDQPKSAAEVLERARAAAARMRGARPEREVDGEGRRASAPKVVDGEARRPLANALSRPGQGVKGEAASRQPKAALDPLAGPEERLGKRSMAQSVEGAGGSFHPLGGALLRREAADRAEFAFVRAVGAGAALAAIAEAAGARLGGWTDDLSCRRQAAARGVVLGLGALRLGLAPHQVGALTGMTADAAARGRAETLRRLEAVYASPLAPLDAVLDLLIGKLDEALPRLPLRAIQRAAARHYGVRVADLLSARRTREVVGPRHVAMYLAKALTPRSLPEIGRQFGGRDHTTVLHAVRKIDRLVRAGAAEAAAVAAIREALGAPEEP
jgi:hypothetical protein